jgi:SAM-dependent methyltransferase
VTGAGPDPFNRATWRRPGTLEAFVAREGPIDPGEAHVIERLRADAAGQPVLDVGVGGGRTVPLLLSLSEDYVGIDYLDEMVKLTRERYPSSRIDLVDARDLSCFTDASFGLVFWSANGIDGISHADRATALREIHRVLRPGGVFAFSTHNLGHPFSGRPPWDYRWFRCDPRVGLLRLARLPRRTRAFQRARGGVVRGQGWATLVDPAYEFGLLTHFVTLAEARRELTRAGFEPQAEAWDSRGKAATPTVEARAPWLHLIARRG